MPEDAARIKERIISVLRMKGPGFPSPIASEIGLSILFTSAFLSELLSEKELKMTSMRVGSSPVYFLAGQEPKLEYFAKQYLKSKEKDAFLMLQEKKILKDRDLEPAIRVALRAIKDFAIPLEKNNELYWKYYIASDEEIKVPEKEVIIEIKEEPKVEIAEITEVQEIPKEEITPQKAEKIKHKKPKKKSVQKQDDKFFNRVKEYLSENKIEITDIAGFSKTDIVLRVKENKKEYILVAYNKKKITEEDIINAHKKAQESEMEFAILGIGEPLKKTANLIEAIKNLKEIKRIKE